MAYDETLLNSVREIIARTHSNVEEKKMFGSLCFMVDDKMCVCVKSSGLLVRIDPATFEEAVEKEGCRPMEMGRKTMQGYVYVDSDALGSQKQVEGWVKQALDYNKTAKPSKKRARQSF